MDAAAQWQQQVGLARSMEEMNTTTRTPPPLPLQPPPQQQQQQVLDSNNQRRARPQKDQNVNCPRCNSTNTKFCYYNNYSLTQPRYFCKTCRRYWTQGGSLRNVPVGGGSRKNKRSTPSNAISSSSALSSLSSMPSTSSPPSSTAKLIPDLNPPNNLSHMIHQNPNSKIHPHPHHHHHGQDLNLAFPTTTTQDHYHSSFLQPMELPKIEGKPELPNNLSCNTTSNSPATTSTPLSALELLRTGIANSSSLSSYVPVQMPDSNQLYQPSGFPNMQDMKPSLMGFLGSADSLGLGHRFNMGSLQDNSSGGQVNDGNARLLFPFGDINKFSSHQNSTTNTADEVENHQSMKGSSQDHHHQGAASGYWNGMLGGGTW